MDEILNQLLSSDVLTEDTKQQITEAFAKHMATVVEEAKLETQASLTAQWIEDRDNLVEAIDSKLSDQLRSEIAELKEDIDSFRDLETEYAAKLVEAKAAMSVELESDLSTLLHEIDSFLDSRLSVELEELKEDIDQVKQLEFGRNIFEAFHREFSKNFVDENSIHAKLQESNAKLADVTAQLTQLRESETKLIRDNKLKTLLSPLSGTKLAVMETLLSTTATEKLDETYNKFIGRVLVESNSSKSEKEGEVLAEGTNDVIVSKQYILREGNVESGKPVDTSNQLTVDQVAELRRLSGQI